jgi:ABC-2 type transport system ATP-binding protein
MMGGYGMGTMNKPIVQLQQVSKKYQRTEALKDVSLDVPRGKIVGIVGPNGSGKTTALKLMAGLLQPDRGKILLDGQPVQGRLISRKVAYLHETDEVYGFFKIREAVDYFHKIYDDFDLHRARAMMEFLELDSEKRVSQLSKGNMMRVKLVLTVARNAPLVLLDEPLSGLDPMVRESIIKGLISFLDMERQTVVLTTHEIDEVEPLLDAVVAIKNGTIYRFEETEVIRSEYGMSLVDWMKRVYTGKEHD